MVVIIKKKSVNGQVVGREVACLCEKFLDSPFVVVYDVVYGFT